MLFRQGAITHVCKNKAVKRLFRNVSQVEASQTNAAKLCCAHFGSTCFMWFVWILQLCLCWCLRNIWRICVRKWCQDGFCESHLRSSFCRFFEWGKHSEGSKAVGYHMLPGWILKTLRHEHRHWRGRLAGLRFSGGKETEKGGSWSSFK